MNKNKAKCDLLKSVRKKIADKLNVDLKQSECTFQGTCTGTCPKCKQEEEILNNELLKRAKAIGVGAIATISLAACGPLDNIDDIQGGMEYAQPEIEESISDDVEIREETEVDDGTIEGNLQYNDYEEEYDEEAMNKIKLQYKDSKLKFETKELMGVIPSFTKY